MTVEVHEHVKVQAGCHSCLEATCSQKADGQTQVEDTVSWVWTIVRNPTSQATKCVAPAKKPARHSRHGDLDREPETRGPRQEPGIRGVPQVHVRHESVFSLDEIKPCADIQSLSGCPVAVLTLNGRVHPVPSLEVARDGSILISVVVQG